MIMPAGMALMGLGLADLSTAGVPTAHPLIAVAVAIMGAFSGPSTAPASNTIMTQAPAHQAGAESAINDTTGKLAVQGASRSSAASPPPCTSPASAARWPRRTCPAP